jgi:nucleotide-binding universal stress UspA family protein
VWSEAAKDRAEDRLEDARERAAEAGVEVATDIDTGRPARTIVDYAEEHDVDGIVMGSHGRDGVARVLLGSVAETVVRRSPIPVTIVR